MTGLRSIAGLIIACFVIVESTASTMGIIGCFLLDFCITDYSTGALNKYPEAAKISLLRDDDESMTGADTQADADGQDQDTQGDDGLRILLGTYSDRGVAKETWEKLKVDYPVLAEVKGGIVQTEDSVGTVYKLYALGLPRVDLLKVCKSIREAGSYCEPVAA